MRTWSIELSGTITRDIIWREVDAETEEEVRAICARELPYYRVRSIIPADTSTTSSPSSGSPNTSDRAVTDTAAAQWEAPHPLRIEDSAHYLVKTNGGEWRDPDLFLWRGYRVRECLNERYVRGRPILIAKVVDPEIAIQHPCK